MILRSLTLKDFGLFAGVTEFDLVPRRRRGGLTPIVLIGGKNGAGKTTLLEAVRLALYGRRALGTRVAQAEYDEYLRGWIHRAGAGTAAAVALEFDYAEAGIVHRYSVRREWEVRGKSAVESLLLRKDGAMIASVPREEWHHFLQELIPPGVSQLFFFDGEKIREIADSEDENEQLAEAVRGLLGIELVSRLRTDIGLYLARHQREKGGAAVTRLEAIIREIDVADWRAAELNDEVAELSAARESQARAAEQIRRNFVSEGGDVAVQRAKIEAEREEVRRAVARAEHELRDMSNKLLPFAMAPKLVGAFHEALAECGGGEAQRSSFQAVREALEAWRAEGRPKREANWSTKHWTDLQRFLDAQAQAALGAQTSPAFREVGDGGVTLARLTEIESLIRPRALALLDDMEALSRRGRELEAALARADNAAAGILLDELRLAEQRVGSTEATWKARQEELKLLRGQIVTLERERRRLLEQQAEAAAAAERGALAAHTAQALADYEHRLLEHKLTQLRGEFIRCFNHLARKSGLIADARVDPASFSMTLIDKDGREVPKAALSAGEKQIYAIAMLWALARTSGRPLPMIIDTPLARLDSDHRSRLVQRYFPTASHQVVLLSTDTEIDRQLIQELGANVSHAYRLDYDPVKARTIAYQGYFNEPVISERRHALQQA